MAERVPSFRRPGVSNLQPRRSEGDTAWKKFLLTRRWRLFSEGYRRRHPSCVMCWAEGRLTPSQHTHHRKGQSIEHAFTESELAPLCHGHHSEITIRERRGEAVAIPRIEPLPPDDDGPHYA